MHLLERAHKLHLVLLLVLAACYAQAARTTVADTLYRADGSTYTGSFRVSWQTFRNSSNQEIKGGYIDVTVTAGVFSVSLEPNTDANPQGTAYTVQYRNLRQGDPNTEYWVVPESGSTLNISQVRTLSLPSPSSIISLSQLAQTGAVVGNCLGWNGTVWAPLTCPSGSGGGDFSTSVSSSVDSEIVLFSGATGKIGKRSTGTGLATLASGVLGTVTAPTGAVVGTTDSQSLTNKTLDSSNTATLRDDRLTLQDNLDTTKQAVLQLSGLTTGTTRTYTLPDATGTIALTTSSITGNAGTSSALDHDPIACATGQVVNDVSASVVLNCVTLLASQVTNAFDKSASNTISTGTQDFSGAAHTLPAKQGTVAGKPATCTVGEEYFATDATAGQNKYLCTATNTWTQQSGGGGGGGNVASINADATNAQTLTKTNDTNVTLTIVDNGSGDHKFNLGWTGTLAAGRLNSSVVQGITNDTNVTGSITGQVLTLGWTGTLAKARQNGTTVYTDQANTFSAFAQDFTAATVALPTGVTDAGYVAFTAIAAPATPGAGIGRLYIDSTSKNLTVKDDAGVIKHGVQTKASVANNFLTAIADDGTVSAAQPAFTNLSGSLACGQTPALTGDVTTSAGSCTTVVGNLPTGTTQAGYLAATAIVAPATPAAGLGRIYVDSTSKNLSVKDDAGVVKHGVQTNTGSANNFVTAISDAGVVSLARPTCANLSDSGTGCSSAAGITQLTGDVTAGAGSGSQAATVVNLPTGVTQAGYLAATAIVAPATPGAGIGRIYVDSTSKNLSVKDDAGVVKHGVQTKAAVTNNFVTAIADNGTVTVAQPAFTDISGTLACGQTPALTGDVTKSAGSCTTVVANLPTGTTQAGYIAATAIAAPATPGAGVGRIYVDSTSKNIAVKDDAGVVKHGVQTNTGSANNFVTAISDAGVVSLAQPSVSNLSDGSNVVKNNQANTYSTGAQDFGSATSLKIPVAAGATAATNGFIAYDSTNNMIHAAQAAADAKIPQFTVTPTNGDCATWVVTGSNYKLGDSACASGGSVFTGSTAVTQAFSATPTFSLADVSGKSPTRFEPGAMTANVTSVTFTNKTAGAKFSIVWKEDATGGRTVAHGASANNTCDATLNTAANVSTEEFYEVAADGTTVYVTGCIDDSVGSGITLPGATSGTLNIKPAAVAGTGSVLTFPAGTTNFSATGGTSQVVKQTSAGGAFTVGQLAFSDISGTLGVSAGGTGQTSFTDGQLLIGNSTGNTLTKATLTAGANITITNSGGGITIASTGGGGGGTSSYPVSNNFVLKQIYGPVFTALTIGSTADAACAATQTLTFAGVQTWDVITLIRPPGLPDGWTASAWASADDTVKIQVCNFTGATATPSANLSFGVAVAK